MVNPGPLITLRQIRCRYRWGSFTSFPYVRGEIAVNAKAGAGKAGIGDAPRIWRWAMTRLDRVLPDRFIAVRNWRRVHGHFPSLLRPRTFNEKILHRILFDRSAFLTRCADKAAVRGLVAGKLGEAILPRLYCLTADPEAIPFDDLPGRFVVKPTHGSGWVEIVREKETLDRAALVARCKAWLGESYYRRTREWAYRDVPPRILVEEFIDDGRETPNDYKLFVFGGVVRLIHVDTHRFGEHRRDLYTADWREAGQHIDPSRKIAGPLQRPPHLAEMIAAAQTLGRGIDFVRVDFYDTPDRLYFGELTMTPGCGLNAFLPRELDLRLGRYWTRRPAADPGPAGLAHAASSF